MEELFLKVLNMSITATYVMIAVLILRLLFRRAPKWISYALWSLVLFRLVCPTSMSSAFSVFGRLGKTTTTGGGLAYIPETLGMMPVPQVDIGTASINTVINNALPAATPAASANPMQILVFIGAWIWLAGLASMLLYSVVSYLCLKRRLMEATWISGNRFETDKISSPFVCGLIKPKIYLPVDLSERERDVVLRHEQMHISRKDHMIKPLAFLVLSIHWFNPFMWLAFILMSHDLEMSCDERVIAGFDAEGKAGYASVLMHLAMKRSIPAGSPLAFGESGVKGRIRNVLSDKKPGFWITIVAVVVVVTAGFSLLTDPISKASPQDNNLSDFYVNSDRPGADIDEMDPSLLTPTESLNTQDGYDFSELTLDEIRVLSQKGDALTFEDFRAYEGVDVSSVFNYHIMVYSVEGGYRLIVRTDGTKIDSTALEGIWEGGGSGIDIRFSDIEKFITKKAHPSSEAISGRQDNSGG